MLEKGRKTSRKRTAAPKNGPPRADPAPASAAARNSATAAPIPPARETESTGRGTLSHEERRGMIAEAAYYRAERRGFQFGDPNRDWIEAEAEIDAMLLHRR